MPGRRTARKSGRRTARRSARRVSRRVSRRSAKKSGRVTRGSARRSARRVSRRSRRNTRRNVRRVRRSVRRMRGGMKAAVRSIGRAAQRAVPGFGRAAGVAPGEADPAAEPEAAAVLSDKEKEFIEFIESKEHHTVPGTSVNVHLLGFQHPYSFLLSHFHVFVYDNTEATMDVLAALRNLNTQPLKDGVPAGKVSGFRAYAPSEAEYKSNLLSTPLTGFTSTRTKPFSPQESEFYEKATLNKKESSKTHIDARPVPAAACGSPFPGNGSGDQITILKELFDNVMLPVGESVFLGGCLFTKKSGNGLNIELSQSGLSYQGGNLPKDCLVFQYPSGCVNDKEKCGPGRYIKTGKLTQIDGTNMVLQVRTVGIQSYMMSEFRPTAKAVGLRLAHDKPKEWDKDCPATDGMENTGKYYMGNEKYGHPHANVMFFTSDSSRTVSEIVGGKQYTITFNFQKVGEHGETDIYAVPHMSFMGDDNNKLTKALLII